MTACRFSLLIFLLLCGSISAWSQERILSEEEFTQVAGAAQRMSSIAPYRITIRSEEFEKSRSNQAAMSVTEISESQSEDRHRTLRIATGAGLTRKIETIRIGSDSFERIDDEQWKRKEKDSGSGGGRGIWGDPVPLKKKEFTFRYLGKDLVNSIEADFYESRKFREYESTSFPDAYTIVDRFWVNSKGKLLKKETENIAADGSLRYRMNTHYEYPANIKIEAPIK